MSSASYISDDFPLFPGTLLGAGHRIVTLLGEGGFGFVAKCMDIQTKKFVAVKVSKNHPKVLRQAKEELEVLRTLQSLDADKCNLIRWHGSFLHEERICLQFELLDQSLFDFMEQKRNRPLPIKELRPVVHQLTTAVTHLESVGIIHADIKPENIMIVDRWQQPLKVKLIDFGIARRVAAAVAQSCEQTLWYRAPEVILNLNITEAIDIWSLGLVAAELALGQPLYPAEHEYDLMKFIVETQGQPADHLLNCGSRSTHFFYKNSEELYEKLWTLKSPEELASDTEFYSEDTRHFTLSSLDEIEDLATQLMPRDTEEQRELHELTQLVKKMMELDANERIKPTEVLLHPFFCDQLSESSVETCSVMTTQYTERDEPESSTQCSPTEITGDGVESSPVTPAEDTVITQPPCVCVSLEGEDPQPEAIVENESIEEGCVTKFFKIFLNAGFCCF